METATLKIFGQVAGVGGLALWVLLMVYRDVIRKNIFPTLTPEHGYRLIRLMIVLVFLVAVVGIGAWVYAGRVPATDPVPGTKTNPATTLDVSPERGAKFVAGGFVDQCSQTRTDQVAPCIASASSWQPPNPWHPVSNDDRLEVRVAGYNTVNAIGLMSAAISIINRSSQPTTISGGRYLVDFDAKDISLEQGCQDRKSVV